MNTRDKILAAVLQNQPEASPLPDISVFTVNYENIARQYIDTFLEIGGNAFLVDDLSMARTLIRGNFNFSRRVLTTLPELTDLAELYSDDADPHSFEDVELAIISGRLAVAENGAVWLTEEDMGQRIIPYICQHLVVIIPAASIVSALHDAYEIIGAGDYGFGGFIGGPSKTADIEQALVLGAHGPLSMTVFVLK